MFKTEEQINSRLGSERNLANRFGKASSDPNPGAPAPAPVDPQVKTDITIIPLKQPGNKEGKAKLSSDQKNEIAFRARAGEKQHILGKEFGVSQSAIGEIEQGRTKVDEDLVNSKLDKVQDVALSKLMESLGYITSAKMEKLGAEKLSSVASNMSKIIGNIKQKDSNAPTVTVQIYAPELKNVSSYKTLDV
jgi:ribosome-binding protein aMBF1 (putative translation factor)